MKTLFAALFTVVMAVSLAQAADVQSAPAQSVPTSTSGWYYLQGGWYLMAPVAAPTATASAQGFAAPKVLPAGMVPAGAPVIAITAPTVRVSVSAEPADYPAHSGGSVWDTQTGNNSGSGDIGSMR